MAYNYDRSPKVAYNYDRQKFADVEDIAPIMTSFGRGLDVMKRKIEEFEAQAKAGDSMADHRASAFTEGAFDVFKHQASVEVLFWNILQQYRTPSAKERRAIERGSKEFSKSRLRRPKRGQGLDTLRKKYDEYLSYYEAAKAVIDKGAKHTDEDADTTLKAGPFTLVNVGGFPDKKMAVVAKIAEEAARLIKAKGFGKICYGNIQVTNRLINNTAAFYAIKTDELFVRGKVQGKDAAVYTLLHELGHRLDYKFLKGSKEAIKSMYEVLLKGEDTALEEAIADKTNWPEPGEEIKEGAKVFVVDRVGINRNYERTVYMHLKEEPRATAHISLKAWMGRKDIATSDFVSAYARTSPRENFAEMFAGYCLNTLEDGLVQMLESVL